MISSQANSFYSVQEFKFEYKQNIQVRCIIPKTKIKAEICILVSKLVCMVVLKGLYAGANV